MSGRLCAVCTVVLALFLSSWAAPSAEEIAALCDITAMIQTNCSDCSAGCGVVCGTETIANCDANQTAIISLSLLNSQLTMLPETIGNLHQLTTLVLRNNNFTSLPESIGSLQQLVRLYLDGNQLVTLPESIGSLQQLTSVRFTNNRLTTVPESIGSLQSLAWLYLNINQLMALPESICSLQNLTELVVYRNQIKALPESIGSLQKLNWLWATGNQLTALPASIGNLQQLTELAIANNWLTSLPESIGSLNLSFVYLSGNCLNCTELEFAPAEFGDACDQSEQNGTCAAEPETTAASSSSAHQQGVTVVVIIKFLEDVTDPTELQEEIASALGIDAGLVSVVVISPTEVEVTIIGSEETAQRLVDIVAFCAAEQ